MSPLRRLVFALIVALFLVPAVGRAAQHLDTGRTPAPVSSFSRSGNVPPDPTIVLPDQTVTFVYVLALLQPVGRAVVAHDEAMPALPTLSSSTGLRAPPALASA